MTYEFITAKKALKDATKKAMDVLEGAEAEALANNSDKAEVLAEIGNGYARLAQAMADAMEATA